MRQIKCVFSTSVIGIGRTETARYYADTATVNFDIAQDFMKILWTHRHAVAIIQMSIYVDGFPISKKAHEFLLGLIDRTMDLLDGEIPLTKLQMELILGKIRGIKEASTKQKPEGQL